MRKSVPATVTPGNEGETTYQFGDFRLDVAEQTLLCAGERVILAPKVFDTLVALLRHRGHLVEKDQLVADVWPDTFVEEANLTVNISALRKALGLRKDGTPWIETVPKRGYRFADEAADINESTVAAPVAPATLRKWTIAAVVILGCVMAIALVWYLIPSPPTAHPMTTLAVLPLRIISADPGDRYLVIAVTDSIITRVSRIHGLVVRPLSAVRRYETEQKSAIAAGRDLHADVVLAGTLYRQGQHLRINFNLLRASDEISLWSDTVDLLVNEPFTTEDSVARIVAERLRLRFNPPSIRAINPAAYDAYLRASYQYGRQNRDANRAAMTELEKAVAIQPDFAAAWARLAMAYNIQDFWFSRTGAWHEKAFVASEKALALDEDLAEAHLARAILLWTRANRFPHVRAIEECRRALGMNPNLDDAHEQIATILNHIGFLDAAAKEAHEALRINPVNFTAMLRLAGTRRYQGNCEAARQAFDAVPADYNPNWVSYMRASVLFCLGRAAESRSVTRSALAEDPSDEGGSLNSMMGMIEASEGDAAAARRSIATAEKGNLFGHFHHTAYSIGAAYALMHEPAKAVEWLTKAADEGFPCFPFFRDDPALNGIRNDPRFQALLQRLRLQSTVYARELHPSTGAPAELLQTRSISRRASR